MAIVLIPYLKITWRDVTQEMVSSVFSLLREGFIEAIWWWQKEFQTKPGKYLDCEGPTELVAISYIPRTIQGAPFALFVQRFIRSLLGGRGWTLFAWDFLEYNDYMACYNIPGDAAYTMSWKEFSYPCLGGKQVCQSYPPWICSFLFWRERTWKEMVRFPQRKGPL